MAALYVFLIIVTILVLIWQYLRRRVSLFETLNVRGPTPSLVVGNLIELTFNKKLKPHEVIQNWTKIYGTVYGYYEGGWPVLVTSDADMVQEIFVKQFANFHGRREFPLSGNPDKDKGISMFVARGMRWKRLRSITNPTFTAMKMKQMSPVINECVSLMLNVFEDNRKISEVCNVGKIYQGLTLDVISRCAFGLKSNCQNDPNDEVLDLCRKFFQRRMLPIFSTLAVLFPELRGFWNMLAQALAPIRGIPGRLLQDKIKPIIEQRRLHKNDDMFNEKPDFVQLMLQAELGTDTDLPSDMLAGSAATMHNMTLEKTLTTHEIVAQGMLFLLAGYETTSTALTYVTYLLAMNLDAQTKLLAEVDNYFPDDKVMPDYDSVSKLPYLDMVIKETLRLYPLAQTVINRRCMETCTIGGVTIPEGLSVQVDVWSLHHNPAIWGSNVDDFDPDRFLPELQKSRPPASYVPFGAGPRNCIGMRFALLEAKTALVRVLKRYRFERCDETEVPLQLSSSIVVQPKNGVLVKVLKR